MELEQQTKFDLLVHKLERSARQRKKPNYQMRVAAVAAVGYGYIGIICLSLFSSLWMVRWLIEVTQHQTIVIDPRQLWTLLGLMAIATFWVQPTPLSDLEIYRADFPELFRLIDELSDRLKAPKIHHIVINYDHNAAIYQTPHLGWQEWHHNYLVLGLPLLQSLSPEQFKATLAHELGHLANNDSSFTSYIYRVRRIWEQLTFDNNLFIFQWFFRWYEPLIKAYSFVSVRDREYAADELAKRITSPEIAASDLIQTYIYQHYLQEVFGRELDRQARLVETPPVNAVTQMLAALRQPLDPRTTQIWLGLILGQATDTDDTHPCLSDRLAAVGCSSPKSWTYQPLLHTAAEHFFGDRLPDLAAELDLRWYESRKAAWLQQYRQAQYQREYLDTLNFQAAEAPLTLSEATIQANLMTELDGELVALQLWQEILARAPDHPQANYQLGKALIDRGHFSGCVYLERSIALDPELVIPSCEELYRFHTFQGDAATAEIYLEWRQQHLPKQWRSKLERNLKDTDQFTCHNLEPDLVNEIRRKLAHYPTIDRAYLVCKSTQIFPDRPLYILGLKIDNSKSKSYQPQILQIDVELDHDLCERLRIELNFGQRLIIATFDSQKSRSSHFQDLKLIQNIQKIPEASIY
jgi:Zn-dependent protease with chaperone function